MNRFKLHNNWLKLEKLSKTKTIMSNNILRKKEYIITWMLHHIFMLSNQLKLAVG